MIFNKPEKFDANVLKQAWKVFHKDRIEYYTYVELAKLVNEQRLSFSTRVTRREQDYIGIPIGELMEFTPVYFSNIKDKIAPPHTKNTNVRSFFRIEDTKEVYLKFSDSSRYAFILKTFGAGGASFKSKDLIDARHFVELEVNFSAVNLRALDGKDFNAKGTLIDFFFLNGDYIYTFEFRDLESRKKVETDRCCYKFSYENENA